MLPISGRLSFSSIGAPENWVKSTAFLKGAAGCAPAFMADRSQLLRALLAERILILDGAMGTMIQRHKFGEADYRGSRFADHPHDLKGNNELLVLTQPQAIEQI